MRMTPRHIFFLCFALTCAAFTLSPSPSCAASGATSSAGAAATSCDPKFMEALRARAYMEAQREVVTNAATIWKPDSVMQLTCFDRQLATIRRSGGVGFSEKDKPGDNIDPKTGKSGTSFDGAVLAVASDVAENHIKGNMGGSLNTSYVHPSGIGGYGPNYQFNTNESQSDFGCANMEQLWAASKCQNLVEAEAFISLVAFSKGQADDGTPLKDPRKFSGQCSGYGQDKFAQAGQLLDTPGVGATAFTSAKLFSEVTAPLSLAGSCFPGIKTGVLLGNNVEEVVCPNPGCVPQNGTCQPQS